MANNIIIGRVNTHVAESEDLTNKTMLSGEWSVNLEDNVLGMESITNVTSVIGGAPHAIAMWGNHGARIYSEGIRRDTLVITLRDKWHCFGHTKLGAPKHPLYLPKATPLQAFSL